MKTIILNGENKKIDDSTTIEQLLQNLDLANKRLAIEINQQIVPRSSFCKHILNEHDKVEIVQAIGGGSDKV
ncbi:sulfur carrier protein ThiS [Cardiobacterium sp. AH-315-I02]|nr:sulfur carrier protein ThiS [Cardiobacterium sp. AH-315-I02]